jgi:hypothetical protein
VLAEMAMHVILDTIWSSNLQSHDRDRANMRLKLGLSARIRCTDPRNARQQTAMGKTVVSLVLAIMVIPWLQAIPVQARGKNIVTDYGATCNGTANDTSAFLAFSAANQNLAAQVQLTIPSGAICCILQAGANYIFRGVINLLVLGTGATITNQCNGKTGGLLLGSKGIFPNANTNSAYVQTVSSGSSCVTMATSSQYGIFTVGNWAVMTAIDMMGYGYPPNPGIFEYVKITSINPSTGVICFQAPLVNDYLSTYPSYTAGSAFNINEGGPATLYPLEAQWYAIAEYRGLTITLKNSDGSDAQAYANLYSVTYTDVTFTGSACGIPSQNFVWTATNVMATHCSIEVDKLIDTMNVTGGTWSSFKFQSSSVHTANFTNGANIKTAIIGTPEVLTCNGSTFSGLLLGTIAYGRSKSFSGINCVILNIQVGGFQVNTNLYSISSGTITLPSSSGPITWAIPNSKPFFSGSMAYEGSAFTINSLSTSGSNTAVGTTLSGNRFPTLPLQGGTNLFIQTEPMPSWSCSGCTGSADAIDYSQSGARGAPIYTYTSRTYTCAANIGGNELDINNPPTLNVWGAPTSITVDVTTADTSSTSPLAWHVIGRFGTVYVNRSGSSAQLDEVINLKTTGTRIMTPSGTSGSQTGDTLTDLSAAATFGDRATPYSPSVANNASTCPVATVTIQTSR